jgi:hypothetical protein
MALCEGREDFVPEIDDHFRIFCWRAIMGGPGRLLRNPITIMVTSLLP